MLQLLSCAGAFKTTPDIAACWFRLLLWQNHSGAGKGFIPKTRVYEDGQALVLAKGAWPPAKPLVLAK